MIGGWALVEKNSSPADAKWLSEENQKRVDQQLEVIGKLASDAQTIEETAIAATAMAELCAEITNMQRAEKRSDLG